ncbi:DUF1320 domain-containing protein [Limimaricola variabilis]|uniref:gp436 family protein n=1 Tax=Limimaricola variabilis TaxID=1492771 RepID=UPI002AC930A8|nr:DUF1320 domain-containing protein [Limimaricola variabilis]WPY94679.1 DUF1320 domain-containing protein [Limimaricola variabilis]
MPYTTVQALTDRYGAAMLVALSDRGEAPTGAIDLDVLGRALEDADAVIDGYLAGRYALPLETVPPLIADLARAIAIWKLHRHEPDPKIAEDQRSAMRTLGDIAKGTVRLPVAGLAPQGTGGTGARMTDRERPFTGANLKGFI